MIASTAHNARKVTDVIEQFQLKQQKSALHFTVVMQILFMVICIVFLEVFLNITAYHWVLLGFLGGLVMAFASIFFLSLRAAHFIDFTVMVCVIFWGASVFGFESDIHHLFVLNTFALIMNYHKNYSINTILIIGLTIAASITLYITDFNLFPYEALTTEIQFQISEVGFILSLIGIIFLSIRYIKGYNNIIRELQQGHLALYDKNKDLIRSNHQLDKFVYTVSHDLKSPISSVKALINLHQLEKDELFKAEYMKKATESLTRMQQFINELLDISRHERLENKVEVIDFSNLIESILQDHSALAVRELKIKKELSAPVHFASDKRRINIILTNLIANAIRYSDDLKEFIKIRINIEVNEKTSTILIEDNGIGIAEEQQSKVFQMFYRIGEVNKNGSGIGLFLVKETVDKLNGSIDITSKHGEGSTFIVTLPNLASEKKQEQVIPSENPNLATH